jgi:hypothetical protein
MGHGAMSGHHALIAPPRACGRSCTCRISLRRLRLRKPRLAFTTPARRSSACASDETKSARPDVTGRAWEAKLRHYLQDHPEAFDPETIDIFVSALDEAWNVVEANKAAYKIEGHAEGARAALARAIVDMAKQGELDR